MPKKDDKCVLVFYFEKNECNDVCMTTLGKINKPVKNIMLNQKENIENYREETETEFGGISEYRRPII